MNSNKSRAKKILIPLTVFLIIAVVVGIAVGVVSNGFADWLAFQPDPPNRIEQEPHYAYDGDGNGMDDGKTYPLPGNMIFTSALTSASAASEGIALTATITPDTATDKSVSWYVEWVNAASEWVSGKTAADYLTATPETDGALTANVRCLQAFGEKIKIRVVSRDNPEAAAECVVDFGQKVTAASLSIGDLNIVLEKDSYGAASEIKWELNRNGVGPGGVISIGTTSEGAYTLADEFFVALRLEPLGKVSTPGSSLGDERYLQGGADFNDGDTLTFDYTGFEKLHLFYVASRTKDYVFSKSTTEQNIECFGRFIGTPYVQAHLTLTGKYGTYEFWGRINITGYTNHATVTSVALDSAVLVV